MGTIVNKTIQEATARLKGNYEAQKIFDMSLGDCVPDRDAIISIIEGLRTVTFPGFFGSENMAYVSRIISPVARWQSSMNGCLSRYVSR